jgi:hypothetical protein
MNKSRRQGFNAGPIDRFMRQPHAEFILAAIAFGLCSAMILSSSDIHMNGLDVWHVIGTRWKFIVIFSLIFAVGGWWTARTWRQLWRCGRSAWERLVYDHGVRLFGFSTAISIICIVSWLGSTADSGNLFGPMMILGALAGVFFGVPVALHLGYFWGNTFAAIVKVEHDAQLEIGEPPHLS